MTVINFTLQTNSNGVLHPSIFANGQVSMIDRGADVFLVVQLSAQQMFDITVPKADLIALFGALGAAALERP